MVNKTVIELIFGIGNVSKLNPEGCRLFFTKSNTAFLLYFPEIRSFSSIIKYFYESHDLKSIILTWRMLNCDSAN